MIFGCGLVAAKALTHTQESLFLSNRSALSWYDPRSLGCIRVKFGRQPPTGSVPAKTGTIELIPITTATKAITDIVSVLFIE